MTRIILAFDIETSGCKFSNDVLALGCSVIDNNSTLLDSLFLPSYFPEETNFESRCYNEFWSKNLNILELLKYSGTYTKSERLKQVVYSFMEFRTKWERYAESKKLEYYIVSDNPIFDGGFINNLIDKYGSDNDMPLPYSAYNKSYSPLINVHCMQYGVLNQIEPNSSFWGLSNAINNIYNIPPCNVKHDHLPHNDAYTIACDFNNLLLIKEGYYRK